MSVEVHNPRKGSAPQHRMGKAADRLPFPGTWPFLRVGRAGRGASSSAHGVTGSTAPVARESTAQCRGQGWAMDASSQWLSREHGGKCGPGVWLGAGVLSCWWLALPCHLSGGLTELWASLPCWILPIAAMGLCSHTTACFFSQHLCEWFPLLHSTLVEKMTKFSLIFYFLLLPCLLRLCPVKTMPIWEPREQQTLV